LPPKNNLIPTNFDLLEANEELCKVPVLLKSTDNYDLWYKKDDLFGRPKSFVSLKVYTQDCNLGRAPEARVFVVVWAQMQDEFLREFNYMANCANLSFDVYPVYDSVNFTWAGFNHTMPIYIEDSIQRLMKMQEEADGEKLEEIFNHVKEKLMGDWKNLYYEQSYQQAFALFENVMVNAAVEQSQMRTILEAYTYQDFKDDLKGWLKSGRQCWYVTGNYDHEAAIELVEGASK
jgi:secreted Zn-dependent insulinase-like peptidase